MIGLFIAETVSLPVDEGAKRNPADSKSDRRDRTAAGRVRWWSTPWRTPPWPTVAQARRTKPRVVLKRVLACMGHIGLVVGLVAVGWRHFDRPIAGLSAAACYLLVPYSSVRVGGHRAD